MRLAAEASSAELRIRRVETRNAMRVHLNREERSRMLCYNITIMSQSADTLGKRAIARQLSHAEQLCAQRGTRLTPLRRQVLEALLHHPGSLKAYELLALLQDSQPGAAPPTVYRALDFLTAQGLIHRLDAINAWSACTDAGGERHDLLLVCTRCGRVAELNDPVLGAQLARCIARAGFALADDESELPEVRALCGTCATRPGV